MTTSTSTSTGTSWSCVVATLDGHGCAGVVVDGRCSRRDGHHPIAGMPPCCGAARPCPDAPQLAELGHRAPSPAAPREIGPREIGPCEIGPCEIGPGGLHVLHVRADPGMVGGLRYSVSCPHDPADMSRGCLLWWPCTEHDVDDAGLDDLGDVGEGPCGEADPMLGGRHRCIDDAMFHPTTGCYLDVADRLSEEAEDLGMAVGDYRFRWTPEEDGALNLVVVGDGAAAASTAGGSS